MCTLKKNTVHFTNWLFVFLIPGDILSKTYTGQVILVCFNKILDSETNIWDTVFLKDLLGNMEVP